MCIGIYIHTSVYVCVYIYVYLYKKTGADW